MVARLGCAAPTFATPPHSTGCHYARTIKALQSCTFAPTFPRKGIWDGQRSNIMTEAENAQVRVRWCGPTRQPATLSAPACGIRIRQMRYQPVASSSSHILPHQPSGTFEETRNTTTNIAVAGRAREQDEPRLCTQGVHTGRGASDDMVRDDDGLATYGGCMA